MDDRPFDRIVGPILDLTEGVCNLTDADTAALDDPDEQAILIAVQLLSENMHARNTQVSAQLAQFQAFLDASPDAVILLDGNNRVQRVNSAALELLGWRKADVFDTPIEALVPALRPYLVDEGTSHTRRITLSRERTPLIVDLSLSRWREGPHWFRAITLRDQTETVAQEQQQRQDQKLQAIGQLSAGIAHEISTPAQYVGNNLHFLERCYAGLLRVVEAAMAEPAPTSKLQQALSSLDYALVTEEVPPALTTATQGLDEIARIVGTMKEFAHKDRGEPEPFDVRKTIETAVELSQSEWKHVAEVKCSYPADLPDVIGWPGEIGQVLLNLVVNAAHAIEEGPVCPGTIWISARADDVSVTIGVRDNGSGMTEEVRKHAFEAFFTTKEAGKGSGQGLSIAQGIVERHSGKLQFDSQPGLGTRFTLRLPRAEPTITGETAD